MTTKPKLFSNRNAVAWLSLVSAVGLHVFDEAITDFLPFYNQSVLNLKERLGFFPAPTFSFEAWLGGLMVAILLGYSLTPVVNRGGTAIRVVTVILGILMFGNACGHLLGSIYFFQAYGVHHSYYLLHYL